MAQLIKCYDYVSRYESQLARYVNQFIKIRNKKWEAYKRQHAQYDSMNPDSFYNNLFRHQLIWASSTATRKSAKSDSIEKDQKLRHMLQWFADSALLLYHPILNLDDVEVELDSVLVTPSAVWVMEYLSGEKGSVFQGQNRRQWQEVRSGEVRRLINPLLSLARSTELVRRVLNFDGERLPIKPVLLVPESFVEFVDPGRGVQVIDQSLFPSWLKSMETYRSPIKRQQLKMVDLFLKKSVTKVEMR